MSDIAKALFEYLSNDPGFKKVAGDRLYPMTFPDKVQLPAATFQFVSGVPGSQPHREKSMLPTCKVQINASGGTWTSAIVLEKAIRNALDGFQGIWGMSKEWRTDIQICLFQDVRDQYDPEVGIKTRQQDFFMMFI
jgi:hypothetical protein